jgi:hypothetical protein
MLSNDGNGHSGDTGVRIPLMSWYAVLKSQEFPPDVTVTQVKFDPHTNNFIEECTFFRSGILR